MEILLKTSAKFVETWTCRIKSDVSKMSGEGGGGEFKKVV